MQQNIGSELHRIVPAEIFEIDERQRSIRPAQAVVEAEIRRNKAAPFLREFGGEIKALPSARTRLASRGIPGRDGILKEISSSLSREASSSGEPHRELPLNLARQARLGRDGCSAAHGASRRRWMLSRNTTAASMSASVTSGTAPSIQLSST